MFDHSVENCQQFAHARDQRDFGGFAAIAQPFVESADHGVASAGNQGSHVERRAYCGSTAPDSTATSECTAVTVEWCDANQCRDLLTVDFSQLRQLGEKRTADDRTDAGDASEQVFVLAPDRALTDALVQILVSSLQLRFQPQDVSVDTFSDGFRSVSDAVSSLPQSSQ